MTVRIAVLGAGANGASIGADLVRAGHDVTLVEQWPAHVDAMRRDGVVVRMPGRSETTTIRVMNLCEVAELKHDFDLVFLLMKAYDSRWACELIAPYLSPDATVVGLQNGMTLPVVESVVGPDRAVGGVIEVSSAMLDPGVVDRHTPPEGSWFALGGRTCAAQEKAVQAAEVLRAAGTVAISDDIGSAKWMKLVVNAAELVTAAIVDLPMHDASALPGMADLMRAAGVEAVHAGLAAGHSVTPILGLGDDLSTEPAELVDALIAQVYSKFALPTTTTTIHQDWQKGRRSEVREINGLVVKVSHCHGLTCPANTKVLEQALKIESGGLDARPENLTALTHNSGPSAG
jgi:2-dehydropantoate 2-reductase